MIPIALALGQLVDLCVLPLAGALVLSLFFWVPARFLVAGWPAPLRGLLRILAALPPALIGLGLLAIPATNVWADGLGSVHHNFPELASLTAFAALAEVAAWQLWRSLRRPASLDAHSAPSTSQPHHP